jgi:hypothetical protein
MDPVSALPLPRRHSWLSSRAEGFETPNGVDDVRLEHRDLHGLDYISM